MAPARLDTELKRLQNDADTQYQLQKRSHDQLWNLLAKSYLWWHEASATTDYLKDLYEKRDIRFHASPNNLPNFNPLIRLVWNFDEPLDASDRVSVSQWSQALQSVHQHYIDNPKNFTHNAEGKLIAYIQAQGGVAGLTSNNNILPDLDEKPSRRSNSKSRNSSISPKSEAEIARRALAQLKARPKGIGTVSVNETVRVGGEGLLLLVARRDDNGRIVVLGSSNDPAQLENVAATAVERDITALQPTLRALVEVISTQAFPSHALPMSESQRSKWFRTRYPEKSDVWEGDLENWTGQGRGKRLPSSKKLILRGKERDLILSGSRLAVSPVTRCILNRSLIAKDESVYLRVMERATIEQWIETGEISLLKTEAGHKLEAAKVSEAAAYKLPVTNTVTGFTKFLHFYDNAPDEKQTNYQADFLRDTFKPDWSVKLKPEWFVDLRQSWADKWFAELGRYNQILRKHNAVLKLKITPSTLFVIFNLVGSKPPMESFSFPSPVSTLKAQETAYFSKDLGPILFNLAGAHIDGNVTMCGNPHALVFRYVTPSGTFEIAVPTLDKKQKHRDGTLFFALGKQQ